MRRHRPELSFQVETAADGPAGGGPQVKPGIGPDRRETRRVTPGSDGDYEPARAADDLEFAGESYLSIKSLGLEGFVAGLGA